MALILTLMYFSIASRQHGLLPLRLLTAKTNCSRDDLQFVKQFRSMDNLSSSTCIYERAYPMTETATHRQVQMPPANDLYNVDSLLSEEERMVRDTVRKFVNERVLPIIGEHFEAGTFPRELIPEVAELGLLGMHLEGYGCAGLSAVCYGLACQELEAGDSGLRSFVSVQGSLVMFPIYKFGSEEQKQRWLPPMARGEVIGCFGLTEPDSGSDPASMRTNADRK